MLYYIMFDVSVHERKSQMRKFQGYPYSVQLKYSFSHASLSIGTEPPTFSKYSQDATQCICQDIHSNSVDSSNTSALQIKHTLKLFAKWCLNYLLKPTSFVLKGHNNLELVMTPLSTLIYVANSSLLSVAHLFISSPQLHTTRGCGLSEVLVI